MKQLLLDIAPAPAPTLDNFVPGRNSELVVALYALASGASNERFIYLWGSAGSGRSHLLRATLDAARRNGQRAAWFGADAAAFTAAEDMFCAVDDVHRLGASEQIAVFNLYNSLRGGNGVLIASGDAPPAQLRLRADLVTRLASGLVYQLHGLNDDEKSSALRRHAEARGFQLPPELADYVLRHAQRDMPSLLALLDELDRYSRETKRVITVQMLRELLDAAPSARQDSGANTGNRG